MENKKIVFITGASSGFGYGVAKELAEQGHIVYASARRVEKIEVLASVGVIARKVDVQKAADIEKVVNEIIESHGRIDVVYNNAGYGLYGSMEDLSMEEVQKQFDINVFGVHRVIKAVMPHMRKAKYGRMIITESMVAVSTFPFGGAYAGSKHALKAMSNSLREEVRDFGDIRVISIRPGVVKTSFYGAAKLDSKSVSDYASLEKKFWTFFTNLYAKSKSGPESTIKDMIKAGFSNKPKDIYYTTGDSKLYSFVIRFMGEKFMPHTMFGMMKKLKDK